MTDQGFKENIIIEKRNIFSPEKSKYLMHSKPMY